MYSYTWDFETGGLLLNSSPLQFSKEPRPVYYQELDILGFDRFWKYAKDDSAPYMWAEANNYYYRGKLVAQTKGGASFIAPQIELLELPEPEGKPLKLVDLELMTSKNWQLIEARAQETIKDNNMGCSKKSTALCLSDQFTSVVIVICLGPHKRCGIIFCIFPEPVKAKNI